jgi:hypothetical protein
MPDDTPPIATTVAGSVVADAVTGEHEPANHMVALATGR